MNKKITARRKWLMAAGLMLVYLPLGVYVNSDRLSWADLYGRLPDFAVQFVVSTVITYGWISFAEWIQKTLRRYFGDYILRAGVLWSNLLAGLLFFVTSMAGIALVLEGTEWLFYDAMKMDYPVADLSHATRAIYGQFATLSLCVYILIANRHIMDHMEEVQVKAEQLEKENLLSQFSALKSQVNPHFLFNSLSILSSLVKKDPDLSEQFIDRLSRAYRYILEQRETDAVPLATELEFLRSYTFLLQTRFKNKFEVQVDLGKNTVATGKIPPLTLQILIENAVKHNCMSERDPLIIRIECDGDLLTVRNKYRPRGAEVSSTGVGLQNIINRYALLTDRPVWAGECEEEFVVKVPVLT
ncbi:MAG TPA: histidine kinase [Saprospiraceae bacterium]|nr:histidine kinase [Saprospiraceae bacterium]